MLRETGEALCFRSSSHEDEGKEEDDDDDKEMEDEEIKHEKEIRKMQMRGMKRSS